MRAPSSTRPAAWSRRRSLALVVALALIAVQTLGLLHRIVHLDRVAAGKSAQLEVRLMAGAAEAPPAARGLHGSGPAWLLALFAGHDQAHDCDAFDQLSHADLAVGIALDAALPEAQGEACAVHSAWHVAAQARGFLARGPPTGA